MLITIACLLWLQVALINFHLFFFMSLQIEKKQASAGKLREAKRLEMEARRKMREERARRTRERVSIDQIYIWREW